MPGLALVPDQAVAVLCTQVGGRKIPELLTSELKSGLGFGYSRRETFRGPGTRVLEVTYFTSTRSTDGCFSVFLLPKQI